MTIYIKILALLIITSISGACTHFGMFEVPPVQGRVIDSETKLPLEGVVIVAERAIKGGRHTDTTGYLPTQQALTNMNGVYNLPELGVVSADNHIDIAAPYLYIFKAGYKVRVVHNRQAYVSNEGDFRRMTMDDARLEYKRISVWDGRDIELEKYEGTEKEYEQALFEAIRFFDGKRYNKYERSDCNWIGVDIPLWYEMINREIKLHSSSDYSGSIDVDYQNHKSCPRWEQFFKVFKR